MEPGKQKIDRAGRKSRIAARLLLRKEFRPLRQSEQAFARHLSQDEEGTNRLIQQGLYYLGIGPRKHAFDQKFWNGKINWNTPAGGLLQKFIGSLPKDRPLSFTLYGSAPLRLIVNRQFLSGDVSITQKLTGHLRR